MHLKINLSDRSSTNRSMRSLCLKIALIILSGSICINAQSSHELCLSYGCFESSDTQLSVTADGDEVFYADFQNGELVWESKIPIYDQIKWDYKEVVLLRPVCKTNVERWQEDKSATARPKEAPEVILYPRDEAERGENNTLICFIKNFFPPSVNITWTKNDAEVTAEDAFKRCLPNRDGTFYVFSYLNFVPDEGDIYSCTVEHEALETPQTRFWEVDIKENSIGPSVLCGLGLSLGLLGVAAGTFFFVKGNQYHGYQDPCL